MTPSTALLLFTKTASQEAAGKQFVRSDKGKNERISQKLISHSFRRIKQSGLPYFVISSPRQRGNSFGEKFTNAVEDIFSLGYQKVIVVGNDSPQLSTQLLIHAANEMSAANLVLGPDKRGGIYLLGISKEVYNRNELLNFRWNTAELYSDFTRWKDRCRLAFNILPALKDVNGSDELQSLLKQKSILLSLRNSILSIVASAAIAIIREIIFLKNISVQNSIDRRGPPTCSLIS
ncbi:MAG: DUF2064 domain-containing protein [Chitinophagales bacterium]